MADAATGRWGSPVFVDDRGDGNGVSLFNEAVEQLVALRGDPLASAQAAYGAGQVVMARVLQAYLSLYSTSAPGFEEARKLLAELDLSDLDGGERELLHARAAHAWASGEWDRAATFLERALLHDPADLLALKVAQDLNFFLGNTRELENVVARVLPVWTPDRRGWGYVQGMYAFGLEENAKYGQAEERALAALDANPTDVWAVHALAHVFEMEGRQDEGVAFFDRSVDDWSDSYFAVHNWWHRALYLLELGEIDEVLALYDGPIRDARSSEWLDVVDAASLLWRLHLFGVDVAEQGDRLAWDIEVLLDEPVYVFNDWHAVMALGLAGRVQLCEDIVSANRRRAAGTNRRSVDGAGLALLEGFSAFARGDARSAADRLAEVQPRAHVVGGSHAQRDVIELTLIAAATRAGDAAAVDALVARRLAHKPAAEDAARRLVETNRH